MAPGGASMAPGQRWVGARSVSPVLAELEGRTADAVSRPAATGDSLILVSLKTLRNCGRFLRLPFEIRRVP